VFAVTSGWASEHRTELFGFLLGFLVGDAGKYYPEYETRARHYMKSAIATNMACNEGNARLLRYVQMALDSIGIGSHRIAGRNVLRWNSEASNLITWMLSVCLGLKRGERTSRNRTVMPWIGSCPKEFVVAFLQGVAESDGYVSKTRNIVEIASVPNADFSYRLIHMLRFTARKYAIRRPTRIRTSLEAAAAIPLFNPLILSYRQNTLMQRHGRLKSLPPSPSFYPTMKILITRISIGV
jgi:hypothetical protein